MRVLMPLPDRDFDVTEVAVPWRLLTDAGHEVVFATERGDGPAQADPLLLTGVLFGQLGAEDEPKRFYSQLVESAAYRAPIAWEAIDPTAYDGLVLPGGHAPGMRQYLGASSLQDKVAAFWALERPVGAICHGPLVLARAGVLAGRRTTCLPKYMERSAFYLTAWRRGRYYRTYPDYVQDEVVAAGATFERGPVELSRRGTATDDTPAFVVRDENYVSARWPGDAYLFTRTFAGLLG
ncbi:type 1 glutamine amidotransferase domain-containing protein [Lentzea sp. NPDC058436]|uniref:type 1 glutamine amidotransferase domain-containing protein n=1 Tax=Lentzea sp. NPDC058436 TaxID=3346499 RepID=UPI0036587113